MVCFVSCSRSVSVSSDEVCVLVVLWQGAVYKINCSDCQAFYIGETGRNLTTRLCEHERAMRKGDINNHIAEHCRLTTLTRSDEGLSDDYPALEKVHVRFSDSYVYANLIIGFVRVYNWFGKQTNGRGGEGEDGSTGTSPSPPSATPRNWTCYSSSLKKSFRFRKQSAVTLYVLIL